MGSCKNRAPTTRNASGSPVEKKRYRPSLIRQVPDPLAFQHLDDLLSDLFGGIDQRHARPEQASQHGRDQRIVRAPQDDGIAPGAP